MINVHLNPLGSTQLTHQLYGKYPIWNWPIDKVNLLKKKQHNLPNDFFLSLSTRSKMGLNKNTKHFKRPHESIVLNNLKSTIHFVKKKKSSIN
jgi:hypothetical protein